MPVHAAIVLRRRRMTKPPRPSIARVTVAASGTATRATRAIWRPLNRDCPVGVGSQLVASLQSRGHRSSFRTRSSYGRNFVQAGYRAPRRGHPFHSGGPRLSRSRL